ncbi:MAG: hypothetical protein ACRENG_08975, partial [bacterium]
MQKQANRWCSASRLALVLIIWSAMVGCGTHEPEWLGSENAKKEWRAYLGDQACSHYSALDQINKKNVKHLEVAWIYHTGDLPSGYRGEMQCNPIIVNGMLYGSSPMTKIFALDAGTGEEIWKFDPFADNPENAQTQGRHRGVTYWQDENGK